MSAAAKSPEPKQEEGAKLLTLPVAAPVSVTGPEFWDCLYHSIADAEMTVRLVRTHTTDDRAADTAASNALRALGDIASFLLRARSHAELDSASMLAQLSQHDMLKLCTVAEAANLTGISEASVRRLVREGALAHQYVGTDLHVPTWAIWQWQSRNARYGQPGKSTT